MMKVRKFLFWLIPQIKVEDQVDWLSKLLTWEDWLFCQTSRVWGRSL